MKASVEGDSVVSESDSDSEGAFGAIISGDWFLVNPHMLIGAVGSVACLAGMFLILRSGVYASPSAVGLLGESGAYHLVFLAGFALSLVASWLLADAISARRGVFLGVSAALAAVGFACMRLFPASELSVAIGSALFGLGIGVVYSLYGELLSWFFFNNIKRYILGVFLTAALCSFIVLMCESSANALIAAAFPIVAFLCYAIELSYLKENTSQVVSAAESDSRCRVKVRSYLATSTAGLASGFAFGGIFISGVSASSSLGGAIAALIAAAVAFFLFRDAAGSNRMTESVSMKLFLPYSAVVAFPLMFVPAAFRLPFFALLLCGSLLPETCSLSAICRHVSLFELSAIRAFSLGRFWSVLGILLGWGIAYLGFSGDVFTAMDADLRVSGCIIAFILIVIFSASFVMTKDNYPNESDAKKPAGAQEGIPLRDFVEPSSAAESEAAEPERSRPGKFYLRCEVVAKTYGFSARQREVLGMLARGRNADYITEKLIISAHTAKAHIYNIYQKTGVHSRQELMDLVENADISDSNPIIQEVLSELALKED